MHSRRKAEVAIAIWALFWFAAAFYAIGKALGQL
jgi:hypothetical protein